MRSSAGLHLSIAALFTIAAVCYLFPDPSVPTPYDAPGTPDNPSARADFERMRLRNPGTGEIPPDIRERELAFARHLPVRTSGYGAFGKRGLGNYRWQLRGPVNIGGRTRALTVDAENGERIMAGGVSGGVWRSTDGGEEWVPVSPLEESGSVTAIVQDIRPGRLNTWYYGTGEYRGNSANVSGDGIFKSTDGGDNWFRLSATATGRPGNHDNPFDYVWRLAVDPSNLEQDELYAAVFGGIFRSVDGGASWEQTLGAFGQGSPYTDVAVTPDGALYATMSYGGYAGIWRSADGVEWNRIAPPAWTSEPERVVIAVSPSDPRIVYFLGLTPGKGKRIRRSAGDEEWLSLWKYTYQYGDGSGGGGRWEDRSAKLPEVQGTYGGLFTFDSYTMTIAVKPDDSDVLFVGGTNLYRSTDGFATSANTTWIGGYASSGATLLDYHYPNHHPDQHALGFHPSKPTVLYSASDGGVHRTLNSMSPSVLWEPPGSGYITTQFYTVAIDASAAAGDPLVLGGTQDNGTLATFSSDPDAPWQRMAPGDGAFCAVSAGRTSYYASMQNGVIYRGVLDAQGTLQAFTRVDPQGGSGYLFVNPFILDPNNTDVMYLAGGETFWRNSNVTEIPLGSLNPASQNWEPLVNTADGSTISALGASTDKPSHRVYFGTTGGLVYRVDDALADKPTVIDITGDMFPPGYVNCIAVDPRDADHALIVFSNYGIPSLFLTSDGGETWEDIGGNLEEQPDGGGNGPSCRWAEFLHRPGGRILFLGTSVGLYSTNRPNGGETVWLREGEYADAGTSHADAIGPVVVDMVRARESDGFVAAATHGRGIYSTYVTDVLSVEASEKLNGRNMVTEHGVTPNPVKERGTIAFTLATPAENVRITIADQRGGMVRNIRRGTMPVGRHVIDFDVGELSAGAYLYLLQVDDETFHGGIRIVR